MDISLQKKYPLVFVFHGGGGNPESAEEMSGFSEKADKEGFIVVYPFGSGPLKTKLLTWNTWDCCGYANKKNIDDVSFIEEIIERLTLKYNIEQKQIYATGISNGGMMCYLLACRLPKYFAAVAPVAASMFDDVVCEPSDEVSMIIFNSVDDQYVPYNGGIGEKSITEVEKMAVDDVVKFWQEKFNCALLDKKDFDNYKRIIFRNFNGKEIILYRLMEGGHSWPGGKRVRLFLDKPIQNLNATDLIWEFFSVHKKE